MFPVPRVLPHLSEQRKVHPRKLHILRVDYAPDEWKQTLSQVKVRIANDLALLDDLEDVEVERVIHLVLPKDNLSIEHYVHMLVR